LNFQGLKKEKGGGRRRGRIPLPYLRKREKRRKREVRMASISSVQERREEDIYFFSKPLLRKGEEGKIEKEGDHINSYLALGGKRIRE